MGVGNGAAVSPPLHRPYCRCPLPSGHRRYQRQIAADIERYGEHYRSLGRRVSSVTLGCMGELLGLVDELAVDIAEKLAGSDDRAVLKELGWPFHRLVSLLGWRWGG